MPRQKSEILKGELSTFAFNYRGNYISLRRYNLSEELDEKKQQKWSQGIQLGKPMIIKHPVTVINHLDRKRLGREGFIPSFKASKVGT